MAAPVAACTSGNQGPTLWSAGGFQFGAMVTAAGDVLACKRARDSGTWSTFNLRTGITGNPLDLPLTNMDEHETPSVGVDSTGIIHVAANQWGTNEPHMVRSTAAHDITDWETDTWAGADASYDTYAYAKFAPLSDGTLFATRRTRDTNAGDNDPGMMLAEVIEPAETEWQFQGEVTRGAVNTQDAFYWTFPYVDANDRIHIFGAWDQAYGPEFRPEITVGEHSYIYSDDAGVTWRNISDTLLTTPFNRTSATAISTRTGIDFGDEQVDNLYGNGCAVDADGFPCGLYLKRTNPNIGAHIIRWDGDSWVDDSTTIGARYGGGFEVQLVHFRGDLWSMGRVSATARVELRRCASPNEVINFAGFGMPGWFPHHDPVALRDFGSVETLIPDGDSPKVWTFGAGARRPAAA